MENASGEAGGRVQRETILGKCANHSLVGLKCGQEAPTGHWGHWLAPWQHASMT